ncbi:MAG TPA: hypothetical protein VKK79_03405 [Candidatus Lokiarchaeia archaeon]|nr:hypothetical protein [Candidatus Lokiarchaeia archaeon]
MPMDKCPFCRAPLPVPGEKCPQCHRPWDDLEEAWKKDHPGEEP